MIERGASHVIDSIRKLRRRPTMLIREWRNWSTIVVESIGRYAGNDIHGGL